jgi:hypothetical protein
LAEHIDPSLVAHINENDLNFFLGWVQSNCKDGNFQFECLSCDYWTSSPYASILWQNKNMKSKETAIRTTFLSLYKLFLYIMVYYYGGCNLYIKSNDLNVLKLFHFFIANIFSWDREMPNFLAFFIPCQTS